MWVADGNKEQLQEMGGKGGESISWEVRLEGKGFVHGFFFFK